MKLHALFATLLALNFSLVALGGDTPAKGVWKVSELLCDGASYGPLDAEAKDYRLTISSATAGQTFEKTIVGGQECYITTPLLLNFGKDGTLSAIRGDSRAVGPAQGKPGCQSSAADPDADVMNYEVRSANELRLSIDGEPSLFMLFSCSKLTYVLIRDEAAR